MTNKYEGLRDPHLNIFYAYGDKTHLENNITKAFINVLQSLNDGQLRRVARKLFNFKLPNGSYQCFYYLQRKPKDDLVDSFHNRIMFAFSPTGKAWGIEGLDTKNEEEIKKELVLEAKKQNIPDEEQNEFIKNSLSEIMKIRENQGSIPDAWLFIYIDGIPTLAVAMENKLHDLDPYQLNNHIEKSLHVFDNKTKPIYKNYGDIIWLFNKFNSFMASQFNEYLIILNYAKVDNFESACLASEELRARLAISFGKQILDIVHDGEKDQRDWETIRAHVNYAYLHEINLKFRKERLELWLSFGPTQNSAKEMLKKIDSINIDDPGFFSYQGFHLLYQRGRILNGLYADDWSLNDFINYWKKNLDYVRTSTPLETIALYQKLYDDGKIKKELLEKAKDRLNGKKNLVLIVPEISLVFTWTYEKAAELGVINLGKSIKEKVELSLREMKLSNLN